MRISMSEYSYLKEYQEWCVSKLNKNTNKTKDDMLLNATLGLAESGEIQNIIKKYLFHEHSLDREKILDECGDLLFYIAVMLYSLDFTFENAIDFNEIKLNKRYKESATKEESINRQ